MLMPALAAWAVIPFAPEVVLADINAGLLYIMALTLDGRVRRDHRRLGVELEVRLPRRDALGGADGVLRAGDGLRPGGGADGVGQPEPDRHRRRRRARARFADKGLTFLSWNWLPLLPMLVVYFVSGVAETNRAPFDVVEGESEIVAGHMVEYSGMSFALFFLAEYMNMMLISALTVLMFFGGWQAPIDSAAVQLDPAVRLAAAEDLLRRVDVPLVPRHLPALPLRPDHAAGLEDLHPADAGLDRGGRHLDADALEPLEMTDALLDFFKGFLLIELLQGHGADRAPPLRAQDHDPVPGGEDADEPALPRPARAAPLSERRGALHRLQAVRGGLPGAGHPLSSPSSAKTARAAPRATTST